MKTDIQSSTKMLIINHQLYEVIVIKVVLKNYFIILQVLFKLFIKINSALFLQFIFKENINFCSQIFVN